jgi:membrane-associated phospholipid phosphatase
MNSRTSYFPALACALFLLPGISTADSNSYKTISDVLALGLPAVAAGISFAQDDASGVLQLAKSEAFTFATTEVLKRAIHETRPNGHDDRSFPSGHAAVAFAAAQYMQMKGGWEFGVPAYLAASVVGYSRVRADEHYWKDVLAGAALGITSSYYFTDTREQAKFSVIFGPKSAYANILTSW